MAHFGFGTGEKLAHMVEIGAQFFPVRLARAGGDLVQLGFHLFGCDRQGDRAHAQAGGFDRMRGLRAQQVVASADVTTGIKAEADMGECSQFDVLNSEEDMLEAQAAYVRAQATEKSAALRLAVELGVDEKEALSP